MEKSIPMLDVLPPEKRAGFAHLYKQYCERPGSYRRKGQLKPVESKIKISKIANPPSIPGMVTDFNSVEPCPDDNDLQQELLNLLVILKLNGGLGTSMGCKGPKAGIEARPDVSFLDATVQEVEYLNHNYGVDVPLVLMNSFNSHMSTVQILHKYRRRHVTIHTVNQNRYPLFYKRDKACVAQRPFCLEDSKCWYPPGTGDVYRALFESGLLEQFLNQGKEYIFISNVDNLAASVHLGILYHMINEESDFCMECVQKTKTGNVEGGTVVSYCGRPLLLEPEQLPKDHKEMFKSVQNYDMINTNNLWVDLRAIQRMVAQDKLQMDLVIKEQEYEGKSVIKFTTVAGAAVSFFSQPLLLRAVPRARFMPVKTTAELFLVQSNLFVLRNGNLEMSADRFPRLVPIINFGPEFKSLEEYWRRFARGLPDIMGLEHLTIVGDVYFGAGVVLKVKGTVLIIANEGNHIDVPDGACLDNKVVTGNLRVFES